LQFLRMVSDFSSRVVYISGKARYLNFARMSKATGESAMSSWRITQRQLES